MLNWLFGGETTPSDEPYTVERNGSRMRIVDNETGKTVRYFGPETGDANPFPSDANDWDITENEYFADPTTGELKKHITFQRRR
ncbi:MAG: hypothetical protein WAN66_05035 [Limnoraphis robusta]|uniref:Uncharacterized protein n=1 Tax=Limnoraphis robusta CS-951 TaxID=1637645 RepID=A0A0F5Y847_9CYAN|nr:hypothetical protein [Limnoraphis robusta]KKD34807.1 hypothetical protein WN50_28835 [Limnoraphis robusta CS-951]